jgi:hypothetical protein
MTETDLADWLPIGDAAAIIGCSTRTIERLGRAKKLEQRLRPQAGSPAVAVYNPDDVQRIASERRRAPAPFVLPAVPDSTRGNGHRQTAELTKSSLLNNRGEDPIRQLAAAFERFLLSPPSPPSPPLSATVAETPWVDLPTAAALLGRSQAYIRRQIKDGRLHAERDRCLVVRRKDLEGL